MHHADPNTGRRGTALARTDASKSGGVTPHWHAGLGNVLCLDTSGDAFDDHDAASSEARGGGALVFELHNQNDTGADDFIGRGELVMPELGDRGGGEGGGKDGGRGEELALGRRVQVPLNTGGVLECTVVAAPELRSRSKNATARLAVEAVRAEGLSLPKALGFAGHDLYVAVTLLPEAECGARARTAPVRESDEHPAWDEGLNNKLAFELDRGSEGAGVIVRVAVWSQGVVFDSRVRARQCNVTSCAAHVPPSSPCLGACSLSWCTDLTCLFCRRRCYCCCCCCCWCCQCYGGLCGSKRLASSRCAPLQRALSLASARGTISTRVAGCAVASHC